jgi:DNA-binding MarR family transcriptional regulator
MTLLPEQERAVRLAVAIKRLRMRLREAALAGATSDVTLSQISILRHLRVEGPSTAASIASAEHISQQAVAQSLDELKRGGLVQSDADPDDGRKRLISMTEAGNRAFDAVSASRNAWLTSAIGSVLADDELPALDTTIELLERLADADH